MSRVMAPIRWDKIAEMHEIAMRLNVLRQMGLERQFTRDAYLIAWRMLTDAEQRAYMRGVVCGIESASSAPNR